MSEGTTEESAPTEGSVGVGDVFSQLDQLEESMTTAKQREELAQTRELLHQVSVSEQLEQAITKYTSRDVGEALVGSIVFALPLLVEDGVFDIAESFFDVLLAGVPVFLVTNVLFVFGMTAGLLYGVDFREVHVTNPIFGVLPRRLVGILVASFVTTTALMLMWGRLFEADPTNWEMFARITVIWAGAALGASLGDILPGESKGTDLTVENLGEFVSDEK